MIIGTLITRAYESEYTYEIHSSDINNDVVGIVRTQSPVKENISGLRRIDFVFISDIKEGIRDGRLKLKLKNPDLFGQFK